MSGIYLVAKHEKKTVLTLVILFYFVIVAGMRLATIYSYEDESTMKIAINDIAASSAIVMTVVLFLFKSFYYKKTIIDTQLELQDLKSRAFLSCIDNDDHQRISESKKLLETDYKKFSTSETYLFLRSLNNIENGQFIGKEKRLKIYNNVLIGFYNTTKFMYENSDLSNDDLFICLMYYMSFSPRHIAACLGVSEDAVRKRKSRLRAKLGDDYNVFFT